MSVALHEPDSGRNPPPAPLSGEDQEADEYLTFAVAGETFAVGVQQVREVLDAQRIARLPNAPPLLLGMIDVRGTGVPVIDLHKKLGMPVCETSETSRLLVLEVESGQRRLVVAALAEAVYEVTHLAAETVEPPPEFGETWDSSFMRGLSRHNGRFVTLLDLQQLFRSLDLKRIGAAEAGDL